MSVFPDDLDSDLEIPRVEGNVTEVSGDVINSIRDAIFAIQKIIGVNAQGNKASFASRVNVSIDSNGYIKRSILDDLGLVSLPIADRHVSSIAAIQETKIDLDHSTQSLYNLISSMRTDVNSTISALAALTSGFNLHILGQANFHDGYHIKINSSSPYTGIAGMSATTVGAAINEISTRLFSGSSDGTISPHIDLNIPSSIKHQASGISVDPSNFTVIDRTTSDVQEALENFDLQSGAQGVIHVDNFHANGILKEINSDTVYNSSRLLSGPISGVSYSAGSSVITIPGITSFASLNVVTGDILVIPTQSGVTDSGSYQIRAVGPITSSDALGDLPTLSSTQLAVFHIFSETKTAANAVSASIYKPAAVSSEFAPLACSARNNDTIVDSVAILNPDAARAVSVGFNGSIIAADGYDVRVKVGMGSSTYRELTIPDLHLERITTGSAEPVNAQSVAERINAYVSDPNSDNHFPITAARAGNELVIAHNLVGTSYTIEIMDGYSGNYALGFDAYGADIVGEEIVGNTNAIYSVNGTALHTLYTRFSGTASISSNSSTFSLYDSGSQLINPLEYGIGPGDVLHVTGHPTLDNNGSYTVLSANSTSVSLIPPEEIGAPNSPTTFNVLITHSHVSLDQLESSETDMGLVQVFVDSNGKTLLHQRAIYGTNFGAAFEIANISSTFPSGDFVMLAASSGDYIEFTIFDESLPGKTVTIHGGFKGSFKLYHPNGLDYIYVNIIPGSVIVGTEVLSVYDPVPADQALLLCTANFNGSLSITNMVDERLFGTLAADQIRDDFIEVFSQKPVSDLRSNGVVTGFDLIDIEYKDAVTDMQAVPLRGGVAYVDGVRIAVETQKVIIQSFDETGDLITNVTKIIGMNNFGSLEVLDDTLGELLTDGYNASSALGKVLPLYSVTITNGLISDVIDVRRFINNIDDKLDLIVDETNNVVGNFRSLEGALLYAESYPNYERLTVKIINTVTLQNQIVVPNGISIIGDAPFGGDGIHQIVNNSNFNGGLITFSGNNRLENVEIVSTTAGLQGPLVSVAGSNINIEKCKLHFTDTISSNSGDIGIKVDALNNVRIHNNRITNVYIGIECTTGCGRLDITENQISDISGIGTSYGISLGTSSRSSTHINISRNTIALSSVSNTDLKGIFIDINESIDYVSIDNNTITGALNGLSENYVSNAIRIVNSLASGNNIEQLVVHDNYIKNVKLHDTLVYGIYIDNVTQAIVHDNTMDNVGVYDANYSDIAYIWVNDNVSLFEARDNTLIDGEARLGIYTSSASTVVHISGNTIRAIGTTSANYIYGLSARANISSNKLIGPGAIGIWWRGAYSKIANNYLGSAGVTYSFKTGILAQASYLDVDGNTLLSMTSAASTGIANVSTANENIKICNNTINGGEMGNLVSLVGNYHTVCNNVFYNSPDSNTNHINLGQSADYISIVGNTFTGTVKYIIYSGVAVTNVSILNNSMFTTSVTSPIYMANSGVTDCMVAGNKLPDSSTYSTESVIGQTPSIGVYNNNTIGVNKGFLDSKSLPAAMAVSGYDSNGGTYLIYKHWIMDDTNSYWTVNTDATADSRMLYFPITCIPNGASIISVQVQGDDGSEAGETFWARIYKRSVNETGFTVTAVSDAKDMSGAGGEFGNGDSYGLVDEIGGSPIDEVVNYAESNYYVSILHSKAGVTGANVKIYGLTVNFRY